MTQIVSDKVRPYPFYSPRFWAGMHFTDYMRMLSSGKFRIHPLRYGMAFMVGGCAAASSILSVVQRTLYGKRIDAVELPAPIFVVGHWRSGTTLLHELLSLDQQFSYPTTFQCFVPNHFLASRFFLEPLVKLLLPATRPMDSMPAGSRLPQEDEFALVGMGAPTPYKHLAFCKLPAPHLDMLDFEGANDMDIEKVRVSLTRFYKSISLQKPGRLVVKSPTHTGRIGELVRWFPDARFIHISRHPHKIVPSTIHLWRSLASVQGFQFPGQDNDELEGFVHNCYERMYNGYFRDRSRIAEGSLIEIQFEELIRDPIGNVRNIYQTFGIEDFDRVLPRLESYWSSRQNYQANKSAVNESTRATIDTRWSRYIEAFGYNLQTV